jgi:hypothetical protein
MRTTVDLDGDLLDRLREEAHRQGVTFKKLLNRVLRRGLEGPAPELPPYRCPGFSMGAPLRPLDKALAVADALEAEERSRKLNLRR